MSARCASIEVLPESLLGMRWARRDVMSERDLVSRAQGGDVSAFESLYRSHSGRIYATCLRMVADPSRAEDLTQEAFLRAWQKLATFRGRSAFGTWLHRLAVNLVLGDLRARRRRPDESTDPEELHSMPARGPVALPEAGIDLDRAIGNLPAQARCVFVLHDIEGFRHGDIARLMGIATGTSKAHLHRARRILRQELQS